MVVPQRDYDIVIQDFLSWEVSPDTYRVGYGGINDEEQPVYIPLATLRAYFKTHHRLKNLLNALFQEDECPSVSYVHSHYLRPFAILLSIGQGHMINYFVEHDSLEDQQLPFRTRPTDFPQSHGCNLWDLFYERQWKYCPIELKYDMNNRLSKEVILPFRVEAQLGQGGSAHIYKICVDEGYNGLSHQASYPASNNLSPTKHFVLKKYRGRQEAEKYYKTERYAFNRLKWGHELPPGIISYHGGFVRDNTYNIILEYADLGMLRAFMQREAPPSSGADIIAFWESLFELKLGLHTIHETRGPDGGTQVMLGWHQDVKPENVLLKSRKGRSIYECDIVLADLGTSHFKKINSCQQDISDGDSHGTYAYGAPEAHRIHKFSSLPLTVKQNVDIWSLGCVYSEVAVWIAHGWKKVEEYQLQRQREVAQKLSPEDGDLFHDGENPLEAVKTSHRNFKLSRRVDDFITEKVLDLIDSEMLIKHEYRRNAMQLSGTAQVIIRGARKELARFHAGTISQNHEIKAWTTSPILHLGPLNFDPRPGPSSPPNPVSPENSQLDEVRDLPPSHENHYFEPSAKVDAVSIESVERGKDREEPPILTVEKALKWRREKKWKMNAVLPDQHLLEDLRNRDHVFIVDNSASMGAHRSEARKVLEAMASMVKRYDPDGVDMLFTKSSREVRQTEKTESLLKAFDKESFTGKSDMRVKLGGILEDYKRKMTGQQRSTSLLRIFRPPEPQRRLSLYVLTDGIWQPECDVVTTITSTVTSLKTHNLLDKQIGIQFIRFGDENEKAKRLLAHLDAGLDLGLDIVDTTPAEGGNVWKMLLGAVNNWFDNDINPRSNPTSSGSNNVTSSFSSA